MFSEERRSDILLKLEQDGSVFVKDLAESYHVSIDSIRRDLRFLENKGLLRRTHGGAMPLKEINSPTQSIYPKDREGSPEQHAITKIAARFIKEDQIIFIGGANVNEVMLTYLPGEISYTIVTNAIGIASYTMKKDNIKTYLTGGKVNDSGNMTDALANQFAGILKYDICFPAIEIMTAKGLSTDTTDTALFYRNVYDNAKSIVGLVDHEKFGSEDKFAKIYPAEKLDVIITDRHTPQEKIDIFRASGIEVIVAVE